jgi:hypothetical protein
VSTQTESSFVTWARSELERAGLFDKDSDYEGMLGDEVMKMVETFSAAGHSGFSAQLATSIFARLSAWKPLTPITSAPDEWMHIEEDMAGNATTWQSRRQPSLFSRDGGNTYYDLDERLPVWRKLVERTFRRRFPIYHKALPPA